MLLHRYSNSQYILEMDFNEGMAQINTAFKMDIKEKLYLRWLVDYPRMKEFMGFNEYLDKFLNRNSSEINRTSKEDIIAMAESIKRRDKRRVNKE